MGQLGTVLVPVGAVLLTMALATALAGGGRSGRSGGPRSYHHACSRRRPSPQIHIMPVGLSGGSGRSLGAGETYRIAVAAAEDVQPCARVPLRETWRVALGGTARHA